MFEEEIFFISNKNIWTPATRKQADTREYIIFWMTHNPNFRENMMPQKLLFSIGPPALLPFVYLEKKPVLYLINISEYQGQIKQAATSEFYHSCITHNSNFRTNMMLQRLLFSIALASCFAIVHMLGEEIYLYPINISEHQRQQSKRPARNLSFLDDPHP